MPAYCKPFIVLLRFLEFHYLILSYIVYLYLFYLLPYLVNLLALGRRKLVRPGQKFEKIIPCR